MLGTHAPFALVLALLAALPSAAPHDPDRRVAALTERIRAHPRDPQLRLLRGALQLEIGHTHGALRDFESALTLAPGFVEAAVGKARALRALGRAEPALEVLDTLPARTGIAATVRWLRGEVLGDLGRWDDAARELDAALPGLPRAEPDHYLVRARTQQRAPSHGLQRALAGLEDGIAALGPIVSLVAAVEELAGDGATLRRFERGPAGDARSMLVELALPATPAPAPVETTLVAAGSTWAYSDTGNDPGAGWTAIAFPAASTWASGPAQLGYGDGDEATTLSFGSNPSSKHITYHLRHTFTAAGVGSLQSAWIRLLRDDGAVVHLNGVEVARDNMPSGGVGINTRATTAVGGAAESAWWTHLIDQTSLVDGTNVVAVEIHQADGNSSDISFDLELVASDQPRVTRGPYLQKGSPSSAVLRWRTSAPTDSFVWLGASPDSLVVAASELAPTTEHAVEVSGLAAATTYAYAVGSSAGVLSGADAEHVLRTHPAPLAPTPVRIWAIGDSGTATPSARAVHDAYVGWAEGRDTDVWLMLGDNAYDSGTDAEFERAVFDTYPEMLRDTFVWPAFGNHEALTSIASSQAGPYFEIFDLPTAGESGGIASGTEAYYSFDYGPVHFVCLDSEGSNRTTGGAMLTWLVNDLQTSLAPWTIAYWHHPPYTKGSHDSDNPFDSGGRMQEMRSNVAPILEAHGVDLVLSGHSHSYERSYLIDGHYRDSASLTAANLLDRGDGAETGDGSYVKPTAGTGSREGSVYVVAGSSGKVGGGQLDHPVMCVSLASLGSFVIDVDGSRLDATFLDSAGSVRDVFTIVKGIDRSLTRVEPRISAATGGVQQLRLDPGVAWANTNYIVLGAASTEPGFTLFDVHVPLNPDPWFHLTARLPNSTVFANTLGTLDASGKAAAAIVFPPLAPALVGLERHHAFVLFDGRGFLFASNPVRLRVDP